MHATVHRRRKPGPLSAAFEKRQPCLRFSAAVIFFLLFAGCAKERRENSATLSVVDFRGARVALHGTPQRVVCLIESALSGIYMLGAEHLVVAVSTNVYQGSVYPQYAALDDRIRDKTLPTPGNWDFVNIESVVALKPDLVIIWASQTEAIENLERHAIPVYGVMLKSIDDVYKEIADFGRLFNTQARADSLIAYTGKEIESIGAAAETGRMAVVYFMWAQGLFETSGKKSTVNELIELAGCRNAADIPEEHAIVNAEKLLSWNPDLIVMWYNEKMDPDAVMREPLLAGLAAVKNRAVYELPSVFYCDLWTLKFQHTVRLVAQWAYPQRHAGVNLDAERKKMMKMLYGPGGENVP